MASKTEEQQLVDAFKTIFQDVSSGRPPPFVQSMTGDTNPELTQMGRDAQSGRLPNMGVPKKVSLEGFLRQGVPPGLAVDRASYEAYKNIVDTNRIEEEAGALNSIIANSGDIAGMALVRDGFMPDNKVATREYAGAFGVKEEEVVKGAKSALSVIPVTGEGMTVGQVVPTDPAATPTPAPTPTPTPTPVPTATPADPLADAVKIIERSNPGTHLYPVDTSLLKDPPEVILRRLINMPKGLGIPAPDEFAEGEFRRRQRDYPDYLEPTDVPEGPGIQEQVPTPQQRVQMNLAQSDPALFPSLLTPGVSEPTADMSNLSGAPLYESVPHPFESQYERPAAKLFESIIKAKMKEAGILGKRTATGKTFFDIALSKYPHSRGVHLLLAAADPDNFSGGTLNIHDYGRILESGKPIGEYPEESDSAYAMYKTASDRVYGADYTWYNKEMGTTRSWEDFRRDEPGRQELQKKWAGDEYAHLPESVKTEVGFIREDPMREMAVVTAYYNILSEAGLKRVGDEFKNWKNEQVDNPNAPRRGFVSYWEDLVSAGKVKIAGRQGRRRQ